MATILRYLTETGKDVFGQWLLRLKDSKARARIVARLDRLAVDNFGDCKFLREGVWELRIDWGSGYRVYFAKAQRGTVLLLGGGDKKKQTHDIERAIQNWKDYQRRIDHNEK
jgi:putative addiction module killer protein